MFAQGDHLDFSDQAALEMYLFETRGQGDLTFGLFSDRKPNGFAIGKRWMNVTIEMWKEDILSGKLWRYELEESYPKWFLDKFLPIRQVWPLSKHQTQSLCEDTDVNL